MLQQRRLGEKRDALGGGGAGYAREVGGMRAIRGGCVGILEGGG